MIIASYRIFDSHDEVVPPYEAARPLPDGKVLGKTDEAVSDGLTAEEMSKFIKENYPESDE
jgi:hypothetical protein